MDLQASMIRAAKDALDRPPEASEPTRTGLRILAGGPSRLIAPPKSP